MFCSSCTEVGTNRHPAVDPGHLETLLTFQLGTPSMSLRFDDQPTESDAAKRARKRSQNRLNQRARSGLPTSRQA